MRGELLVWSSYQQTKSHLDGYLCNMKSGKRSYPDGRSYRYKVELSVEKGPIQMVVDVGGVAVEKRSHSDGSLYE